jgi:thiamine-monophosphate kinase
MIDLSDGLAGDLGHLCAESGIGAQIVAEALPLQAGVRQVATALGEDAVELALRGGEDFELCCTAVPGGLPPLLEEFRALFDLELTRVGTMTSGHSIHLLRADGTQALLLPQAFDHFQR